MHLMAESPALPLPPGGRRIGFIPGSDAKLARRAAAGDERAFAAIYERFHQELYRYCRAILGDPEDAQDALQGTMASALGALPGETRTIALRPWLYRVARNEALTIVRRRQSVAELDEAALPVHPAADVDAESRERLRLLVADLGSVAGAPAFRIGDARAEAVSPTTTSPGRSRSRAAPRARSSTRRASRCRNWTRDARWK